MMGAVMNHLHWCDGILRTNPIVAGSPEMRENMLKQKSNLQQQIGLVNEQIQLYRVHACTCIYSLYYFHMKKYSIPVNLVHMLLKARHLYNSAFYWDLGLPEQAVGLLPLRFKFSS
jgi:hypothetical protein